MHKIIKIILAIIISIVLFFAIGIAIVISTQDDKSESSKKIADIESSKEITDIESSKEITDIKSTNINPNKYNNDNYTCDDLRELKSDLKDDIRTSIFRDNLKEATEYEKERDMVTEAFSNKCNIEDYYEDVSCNILKEAIDDLKWDVRYSASEKQYLNENREELNAVSNVYDRNCDVSDQYENMTCDDLKQHIFTLQNDIQLAASMQDSETLNDKRKEIVIVNDVYSKKC